MKTVSCIVCAYNEEARIGGVLTVLSSHPLLNEIIVVDDGSKDRTAEIARSFSGVTVISPGKNQGKSYALTEGLTAATGELILLIDADLLGLHPEDITALLNPVLSGATDVSISLRKNSLGIYKMMGLDFVSGERVIPRDLLGTKIAEIRALPGFGLEVYMNSLIIEKKLRLQVVYWDSVVSPRKSVKVGFWKGVLGDISMIQQIFKTVGLMTVLRQNYQLITLCRTK